MRRLGGRAVGNSRKKRPRGNGGRTGNAANSPMMFIDLYRTGTRLLPLRVVPATGNSGMPRHESCSHYLLLPERAEATWWGEGGPAGMLVPLPNASRMGSTTTGIKRPWMPNATSMRPKRRPMTRGSATGISSSCCWHVRASVGCQPCNSIQRSDFYVSRLRTSMPCRIRSLRFVPTPPTKQDHMMMGSSCIIFAFCVARVAFGQSLRCFDRLARIGRPRFFVSIRPVSISSSLLVSSRAPASVAGSTSVMVSLPAFLFHPVPTHRGVRSSPGSLHDVRGMVCPTSKSRRLRRVWRLHLRWNTFVPRLCSRAGSIRSNVAGSSSSFAHLVEPLLGCRCHGVDGRTRGLFSFTCRSTRRRCHHAVRRRTGRFGNTTPTTGPPNQGME